MKRTVILSAIVLLFTFCKEEPVKKPISPKIKIEFRLASENQSDGFEEKVLEGKKIYLNPQIEISEKDIAIVYQTKDNNSYNTIFLELNKEGTIKFASLTEKNIEKMLAIVVNGNLIMHPIIQSKIPEGKIAISSSMTEAETDSLFRKLTD